MCRRFAALLPGPPAPAHRGVRVEAGGEAGHREERHRPWTSTPPPCCAPPLRPALSNHLLAWDLHVSAWHSRYQRGVATNCCRGPVRDFKLGAACPLPQTSVGRARVA